MGFRITCTLFIHSIIFHKIYLIIGVLKIDVENYNKSLTQNNLRHIILSQMYQPTIYYMFCKYDVKNTYYLFIHSL